MTAGAVCCPSQLHPSEARDQGVIWMLDREWITSSYSQGGMDNCVQVRSAAAYQVDVRDSQHPGLGQLSFGAGEWRAFLATVTHM